MPKKRLPKTTYLVWINVKNLWNCEIGDEPILISSQDPELLSETDNTVEAGLYELVKKIKITSKTTVTIEE